MYLQECTHYYHYILIVTIRLRVRVLEIAMEHSVSCIDLAYLLFFAKAVFKEVLVCWPKLKG
jgi:hypothetical protein